MMRRFRARDGFTLIEIMVATLLLLVAMAGFVPFFLQGLNQSSSARYRSIATNIARERMEQIRQLDYREITVAALIQRFGNTKDDERGATFNIQYVVDPDIAGDRSGALKKVTVTVDWTAPPQPSPISVTTLIHRQFLGPRGSLLTITPGTVPDDLGTPFGLLVNVPQTIRYDIAEADWGLCYPDPTSASSVAYDVYARMVLVADDGFGVKLGDPLNDYKIEVQRDPDLQGVYFEVPNIDVATIPDGYWELQAQAYNEYDEPGNLWRLRIRVEKAGEGGRPAKPELKAVAVGENSVLLTWTLGDERDRKHLVLQRSLSGGPVSKWRLPRGDTALLQTGASIPPTDPWGPDPLLTPFTPNSYDYKLWAVDFANHTGDSDTATVELPGIVTPVGPATKYIVTSSSYSPIPGATVTITAQLTDVDNNPVATSGNVVTWTKSNTHGSFATATSATNTNGVATVVFTTHSTAGTSTEVTATTGALTGTSPSIFTTAALLYSVQILNGTGADHAITIQLSGSITSTEYTSRKNETLKVDGLAAGEYSITTDVPGLESTFSLPDQADDIVLSIL